VLQCVAVCCRCVADVFEDSVLMLQYAAVCCSVLQWLQCVALCCDVLQYVTVCYSVLQCADIAVCCSVLQCVAVCCSVLQCVAGSSIVM